MQNARRYFHFVAKASLVVLIATSAFRFAPTQTIRASGIFDFIVADDDMTDAQGMSAETLRRFLLERGTLGKVSFQDTDGATKPAYQIIYRIAQEKHLNPKFLLVLLQREQSLVEDPFPSQDQYDWAVGYGVCDSCAKDDPGIQKFRGFAQQLENAADRINQYVAQNIGFQVGQDILIDGLPVTPANKATAVLYTYTPHLHGNNNFRDIWRRYFLMRYPDGTLLKSNNSPAVYLIHYGRKRSFQSWSALTSRYDPKNILTVNQSDLDPYETGPAISFPNYSLLQTPDQQRFLLVDDALRPIDAESFRAIGFNPDELIPITEEDKQTYSAGTPLTAENSAITDELIQTPKGGIFAVRDGIKHAILSPEILKDRYPDQQARKAIGTELDALPTGEPVVLRNGTLVKAAKDATVYLISNGVRRAITSEAAFASYGFEFRDVITTSKQAVELHPLGNPIN